MAELRNPGAPVRVREFLNGVPDWLILTLPERVLADPALERLDPANAKQSS